MTIEANSNNHSGGWILFTRVSFVASMVAMGVGVVSIEADLMTRAYFALAALFMVSSTFTLSKTMRDVHEEARLLNKISEAKTNKILKEFTE